MKSLEKPALLLHLQLHRAHDDDDDNDDAYFTVRVSF